MRAEWVAADLPADAFWRETPRSYLAVMEARQRRDQGQMIMTARAVWVGTHASQDQLTDWADAVAGVDPEARLQPPEALPMAMARATAGVRVITMAEYIRSKTAC